ncbi:MAG: hypothetical protein R2758_13035 [Bacteroidales bacterium]
MNLTAQEESGKLEKQINAGKLTKSNLNSRGYNKYLKLEGDISISSDYQKYDNDRKWDGIKGYVTNTNLSRELVVTRYRICGKLKRRSGYQRPTCKSGQYIIVAETGLNHISASVHGLSNVQGVREVIIC